jgi:hypothetical protein
MITGSLKKSGVIFFKQLYDQIKMKTQLTRTCSMQQRQFKEKSLCLRVHLLKTTERSQINNLMMHLKVLEKQQTKPQISK